LNRACMAAAEDVTGTEEIIKEGYLELQEGKGAFRKFKRRYMVVKRSGVIELHSSQESHRRQHSPKESFHLQGGEELIVAVPYKNRFRIKVIIALHKKEHRWCFAFESETTQKAWIAAFDGVMKHLAALLQLNEALTGSNVDTLHGQIKIGEALAECGQLSKARRIFKKLVSEYGDAFETAHESYEYFLSHHCKDVHEAEANFVQRKKFLCVPRQFITSTSGAEFLKLTRRIQFKKKDENTKNTAENNENDDDDKDVEEEQKSSTGQIDIDQHWPFYLYTASASHYAHARQLAQHYVQQQQQQQQQHAGHCPLEYSYKDIEQRAWFIMNECVDGKRNTETQRLQARLQAVADAEHQKRLLDLKQQRQQHAQSSGVLVTPSVTISPGISPGTVDDILDEIDANELHAQPPAPTFEVMPSIVDNTEELRQNIGKIQFADLDQQRQANVAIDKLATFDTASTAFASDDYDEDTIRDAYLLNMEVTDILGDDDDDDGAGADQKRVSTHRAQSVAAAATSHLQTQPEQQRTSASMNQLSNTQLRESALLAVDEILDHVFGTIYEVLHRPTHHVCPWTAFLLVWQTRRDEMHHIGDRQDHADALRCVLEFVYFFVGGVFEQFDRYGNRGDAALLCALYANASPQHDPDDVRHKLCLSAVRVMSSEHISFACKRAVSRFLRSHGWLRMIASDEKRVILRRCFEKGLRCEMRRILSTLRGYYRDTVFTDLLYYDLLDITTKHKVSVAVDIQCADKVQGECSWGPFPGDHYNSTELANVCAARKISPVPEATVHPGSFEECYLLLCHEMSKKLNGEFHRQIQLALKMHKIAYVQFEATPAKDVERCLALLHHELAHFSSPKAAKILDYCKCTVTLACVKDVIQAFKALDTKFKVCKIVNFFDAKHNNLGSYKYINVYLICKHKDVKPLRLICEVKLTLHTIHEMHTQRNHAKTCYGEMLEAAQIKEIMKEIYSNSKK